MRYVAFVLVLFAIVDLPGMAQEPIPVAATGEAPANGSIEKVEVSGVPEQSLSANLREDLQRLVGQLYDATIASQFAERIQSELVQYLAAARTIPGTQPDRLRLIFIVARVSDDSSSFIGDALRLNINAQYTVEAVELDGLPRSRVSDALYEEMQKMVGQRLDNRQAEQLRDRLAAELKPEFRVFRRIRRGTQLQHVKVVYEGRKEPWLPLRATGSRPPIVYHSSEGFSGDFVMSVSPNYHTFNLRVANSGDKLIERYAGWGMGFESRRLGTDRLGIKLDYSSFRAQWSPQTLNALSNREPYRLRRTIEPSIAFAVTRNLYITAGTRITELQAASGSEAAHEAVASVQYRKGFESQRVSQSVDARYEVNTGTRVLDSDYIFTRHSWDVFYAVRGSKDTFPHSRIGLSFHGGVITGTAPLFERFTLGDSRTLRGWNKFDLAPLGGSRTVHGSLGYSYRIFHLFYDAGTVWDAGQPVHIRQSAGFGFHEDLDDRDGEGDGRCFSKGAFTGCWFVNVGIPIRNARLEPTITVGIGF